MRRLLSSLMIVGLIIAGGCIPFEIPFSKSSSEAQQAEQAKKEEAEKERIIPEALKGVDLPPAGKYAGDKYDWAKVKEELDRIPKDATGSQILKKFYELAAEDYTPYFEFFETFDPSNIDVSPGPGGLKSLKLPEQKSVNIMILVDSSGSMAGKVDGGMKMDLAKNAVKEFADQMPAGANVSLVAYGHKGSNQSKDKAVSCKGIEEVFPLGAYDESKFNRALDKFKPVGYTPLADSLKYAQKKLSSQKNAENIVYVVSDGIETCGGDPVKAAKELNQSDIKAVVNIIGFDLDDEGQKQLKAVANAGGGEYSSVDSKVELDKYFEEERRRLYNAWSEWAREHYNNAQDIASQKTNQIDRMYSEFKEVADREERRFDHMAEYLEDERGFEFSLLYNHVKEKYRERAGYLRDYRMYIESELKQQVWDERDKVQDHVTDKRDEEQDKLY